MRVRRETAGGAGDDDEADIGFDSGVISLDSPISNASAGVTATTLGQFLNVGTVGGTTYTNPDSLTTTAECLVVTWMDQSANSYDATNSTQGEQPQIHAGTVNTDLNQEGSIPCVTFNASTTKRLFFTTIDPGAVLSVSRANGSGFEHLLSRDSPTQTFDRGHRTYNGKWRLIFSTNSVFYNTASNPRYAFLNATDVDNTQPSGNTQHILYVSCTRFDVSMQFSCIGSNHLGRRWGGTMQEIAVYGSVQADFLSSVANSYYSIY